MSIKLSIFLIIAGLFASSASSADIPSYESNVTGQLIVTTPAITINRTAHKSNATITLVNKGQKLEGFLTVAITGLPVGVSLTNASGVDGSGNPTLQLNLPQAGWTANASLNQLLAFTNPNLQKFTYGVTVYGIALPTIKPLSVTTYHNDNLRTGSNSGENQLLPPLVSGNSFGLLATAGLDDQVDAQPLVVPNVHITAKDHAGLHDVVYVATENNTIYALDASSGKLLISHHFGPPVPAPLGCNNNGPNVGITSTPVIDKATNTLYVITYTLENNAASQTVPVYRIHALDLGSLDEKIGSVMISASHVLNNGKIFPFNATYQRQRPGLLEANGNIYAGFGSFCDFSGDLSRGWLLGWNSGTLQPLPANYLLDTQADNTSSFFLSSIWMSGSGIAADSRGSLYFVTGNSTPGTYDGVTNIQESVVKMASDLSTVSSIFTPSNVNELDGGDTDFGSGGVMLLPVQPGNHPNLSVAAGKDGRMFLMSNNGLGGYNTLDGGRDHVLQTLSIGPCWCVPSTFTDPNHVTHVITSGGQNVQMWSLKTSSSAAPPQLSLEATSSALNTGQEGGFFTTVSSSAGVNPIVWAVSRPVDSTNNVYLYAFDAANNLTQLFSAVAGNWPNTGGNANIVPVVANGKVYVASNKKLSIFGLH